MRVLIVGGGRNGTYREDIDPSYQTFIVPDQNGDLPCHHRRAIEGIECFVLHDLADDEALRLVREHKNTLT